MRTTPPNTRARSLRRYVCSLVVILLILPLPAIAGIADVETNPAAPPFATNYVVTERGPHHSVSSRVEWHTNSLGKAIPRKTSYTTLATGLHVQDSKGNWVPADPALSLSQDGGASASNTQHKLYIPGSLYNDAIRCTTPDGKTLISRPLGLAFSDGDQTVWVAQLRDGPAGQLLPSGTEALYTNICDNPDVRLDLRIQNKLSGMESDLIIRTQLPDPATFGFSNRVEIQWWTEFLDSNAPALKSFTNANGAINQTLDFGAMRMDRGSAFLLGNQGKCAPVIREWATIDGRSFLIEKVFLDSVSSQLSTLPVREALASPKIQTAFIGRSALPKMRTVVHSTNLVLSASAAMQKQPGFVVDYDLGGSYTGNYTLQADSTYVVTNVFSVSSNLICEGGAVIKYRPGVAQISIGNDLICKTAPFRPIIFTGIDDDTVGTTVPGSTSDPTNNLYGQSALSFPPVGVYSWTQPFSLSNARFLYMSNALDSDWAAITVSDCQFLHGRSLTSGRVSTHLRNVLLCDFAQIRNPQCFEDGGGMLDCPDAVFITGENVTAHDVSGFDIAGADISLTNCLFVNASFTNIDVAVNSVFLDDDTGVFQSVGGGDYYLADYSTNRDGGTTNIDPTLLADLRTRTTYPPVLWANMNFSAPLALTPQVPRDTNGIDIGYHYECLDFEIGASVVSNSTVTISPGTVVALFGEAGGQGYGLALHYGSTLTCSGAATNEIWLAAYNLVQESNPSGWVREDAFMAGDIGGGDPSVIDCRFTHWASPAADCQFIPTFCYAASNFKDSQFHGGNLTEYNASANLTNCLLERVTADLEPQTGSSFNVRNNLFFGGSALIGPGTGSASVKDNLFDRTDISAYSDLTGYDADYNAFVTNASFTRLYPNGANDIILTNSDYVSGPLGNYYYPTNGGMLSLLIDRGSVTNAGLVGLYHYTTTTNISNGLEIKDGATHLDIGWHHPAVDTNGFLIDTDGDRIPDLIEDANGNGIADSGETDWLDFYNGVAPNLTILIGDGQSGTPTNFLALPLRIIVADSNNVPLTNGPIVFSNAMGGILLATTASGTTTNTQTVRSDTNGEATVYAQLPAGWGSSRTLTASAYSGGGVAQVVFTETNMQSTRLWLKADAGAILDAGTANSVRWWQDQSGNGNHGDIPNYQPFLSNNVVNGKPVLHFWNGINLVDLTNFPSGLGQAEAFAMRRYTNSIPEHNSLWKFSTNTIIGVDGADDFGRPANADSRVPAQAANAFHLYSVLSKTNEWTARINGRVHFTTHDNPVVSFPTQPHIGNGNWGFIGDLPEVMLFDRDLSWTERDNVGFYFNARYAWIQSPTNAGGLSIAAVAPNQVSVTWTNILTNSSVSFIVQRKVNSGLYSQVAVVRDGTSYFDANAVPGATNTYRLLSANFAGVSSYSPEVSVATPNTGTPVPVSDLRLWLKGDSGIVLNFSTNMVDQWLDQSGATNHAATDLGDHEPAMTNSALHGLPGVFCSGGTYLVFSNFLSGAAQVEAFVLLNAVSEGKLWTFGAVGTDYPDGGGHIIDSFGRAAAMNVGVPLQHLYQFHLYDATSQPWLWASRVNGRLLLSTDNTTNTFASEPDLGHGLHGTIEELMLFDRVLSPDERDSVSVYLNKKYNFMTATPPTPGGLVGTGVCPYQLSLSWTNAELTNGLVFTVERKTGSGGAYATLSNVRDAKSFTDDGVTPGTTFYYRVKSWNYNGYSAYSSELSPPAITLTNPSPESVFTNSASVTVGAIATSASNSITNVQFYLDKTLYGSDSTSPFGLVITNINLGAHTVTAKAIDSQGNSAYSQAITFVVSPDTDGDGLNDYAEIAAGRDPTVSDNPPPLPPRDTNDVTAPIIYLDEPAAAVLIP